MKKQLIVAIAAITLSACIPAGKTYIKKPTINDYNHKSHLKPFMLDITVSEDLNTDYCIVSRLEYNRQHDYYTVYALSSYFNSEICIADDITRETAIQLYFPGSKLMRFWFHNTPYYTADIILLEKP